MKRRWTIPARDLDGEPVYITIYVPSHAEPGICASATGRDAVVLHPESVERVRQALQEARAVAIWERGDWS